MGLSGVFSDGEHRRLPNSLPVVGRDLADRLITERFLETQRRERCWRPDKNDNISPEPSHKYVRALFAVINAGGTRTIVVVCGHCGQGRRSVPFSALTAAGIALSDPPELADYRRDYCERCGTLGAQLHHMAPQAVFPDADDWPLAYLCQTCHAVWHAAMNAAAVRGAA